MDLAAGGDHLVWYLGEQFINWTDGPAQRPIPSPSLSTMFWASEITKEECTVARLLYDLTGEMALGRYEQ